MRHTAYWWKEAKLYELYIDMFAGDIKGLTAKLGYFTTLGVNCLHILPHYPSPMVDDGYDISDYRGVRHELGTVEDFKELVRAAHEREIHIVIDWPLNHTSNQHPWFLEAKSSKENPKRDFYLWSETGTEFEGATNAFPDIKPENWISNPATNDYYYATFYPEQPDLNWDNAAVFEEMAAAMIFWAEIGVDGFRLDAAPYLLKRNGTVSKGLPETHALIKRIRTRLETKFPGVILIAEAHQDLASTKDYFGAGDECHMAYHFGLMEQLWVALMTGEKTELQKILDASHDIPENCQWATFLRNHDEISLATLSPADRARLVALLDLEHRYVMKKIGFTAMRIASVFDGDRDRIIGALSLLYSLPGAPVMYYGDEIGMRNLEHDPRVVDTRTFVRGQFDWQAANAQMRDPRSLFNEIARMIHGVPAPATPAEEVAPVPAPAA